MPPPYATGHVRHPQKNHLQQLSARRHRSILQQLLQAPLPSSFDSRSQGWVGPIKSQASCGSCWCFSGTGVVEIAYYKAGVLKPDGSEALSEQYTLDCGRNGGCGGDDNITVLQGAKQTGIPKTSDYGPYQGRATRCNFKQTETLYKIDDWGFAEGNQGQGITPAQAIKAAIFTYGCVGAAIAADGAFQSAKPGQVFQGSGSRSINHDIILIGWDDSKGSGGKTAWLLRNSWDVEFCDQGYCWILEGANEVGTEACWAHINAAAPPIDWYV